MVELGRQIWHAILMKATLALTFVVISGLALAACSAQTADVEPAVEPVPSAAAESASPTEIVVETAENEPVIEVLPTPTLAPAIRLENLGPAPEIANDTWINSDAPLTLASQRGKVVLMEFWTFGCINCQRVTPYIKQWHTDYAGDDFQVITIHYPEFGYEKEYDNVVQATVDNGITYPVALDNDGRTWRAFRQRYWPTTYLIDKDGDIRYKHIGEFSEQSAAEAEAAIEALLPESAVN